MKYTISDAILQLKPGADYIIRGDVYSGIEWLDSVQTKPTETEINNKISELDAVEAMRLLRLERNARIAETDWRASSDLTISDAWKTYRQALRDLPASNNKASWNGTTLSNVTFPTKPTE